MRWANDSTGSTGQNTVSEMVDYIDNQNGKAYTWDGAHRAEVGVVHPSSGRPYIRTHADGNWTNNLLALPRY